MKQALCKLNQQNAKIFFFTRFIGSLPESFQDLKIPHQDQPSPLPQTGISDRMRFRILILPLNL